LSKLGKVKLNNEDKVVIIGWDGATWDIINPLIAKGKLPNLQKLMGNGVSGCLKAPMDPNSFASWVEFATGVNIDKHSIFCSQKRQINDYNFSLVNSKDVKVKTLWRLASEQGCKVGVINVPVTYPPEEINGFLVSGIIVPGGQIEFTYPLDLSYKLLDYGYSIEEVLSSYKSYGTHEELLNAIIQSEKKRLDSTLLLMKEYKPDFSVVVFVGIDRVQHHFWHFMDKSHPMYVSSAKN
jgi:predicted AlkP superfamily phosphohydrolase/phosphomutase